MRSRSATLRDKRGNPVGTVRAFGKTVKQATAKLRRVLSGHLKNVRIENPADEIRVGGEIIKVTKKISGGLPKVTGLGSYSTHARKKPSWARGVDGTIYRTSPKGKWRRARPGELSPSGL